MSQFLHPEYQEAVQEKHAAATVQNYEFWRSTKLMALLGGLSIAATEIGMQLDHTPSDGLHFVGSAMIGVGAIGLTSVVLVIPSVLGKYRDYKFNKSIVDSYQTEETS